MNPRLASYAAPGCLLAIAVVAVVATGGTTALSVLGACTGTAATAALLERLRGDMVGLRTVLTTGLLVGLAVGDEGTLPFACLAGACATLLGAPPFSRRGRRLLNPAMAGYLVAVALLPQHQVAAAPAIADIPDALGGAGGPLDGLAGASALWALQADATHTWAELRADPRFGALGDAADQYAALAAWGLGALLLALGVIPWQIPLGFFAALFLAASLGFHGGSDTAGTGLFHLFSGGAALAGWFILTDPGSRARTGGGMAAVAVFAGFLLYATRSLSPRADALAATVLLANLATPVLDRWARLLAVLWRRRTRGRRR